MSVLWGAVSAVAVIGIFHGWAPSARFRTICGVFVVGLVGYAATYGYVLARSPGPVDARETAVAFLNGAYFYAFWIFGIFAQGYSLADRGFSLTMLTDLLAAGGGPRSREDIKRVYAGGQGMDFVRHKRLAQILHGRFIRPVSGGYASTALGRWIGRGCLRLQRLYRFHETG